MGLTTNTGRRTAMYYWRRRLPRAWALQLGRSWVKLSLQTREPIRARFLAAQLNATAAELFMTMPAHAVTGEQLSDLFKCAFAEHNKKLDLMADQARQEPGFDPDAEIAEERAWGAAYSILARRGRDAQFTAIDEARLREQAGLAAHEMATVAARLTEMQRAGHAVASKERLRRLLEAVRAEPSAGNLARAEPIYMRALSEAFLRASARYDADPFPFADLVAQALPPGASSPAIASPLSSLVSSPGTTAAAPPTAVESEAPVANREPDMATPTIPAEPHMPAQPHMPAEPNLPAEPHAPAAEPGANARRAAPRSGPDASIAAVGKRLISKNRQDNSWQEKTARQAASIFDLFGRFLVEEHGVRGLDALAQHHCADFDDFLRTLFKSYGKSPGDKTLTIRRLRAISDSKPEAERGLAGPTRNRHLTFLGQLLEQARTSGVAIDRDVTFSGMRAKKRTRGRDDRTVPTAGAVAAFFAMPVFKGCRSPDDIHAPGETIVHRAAYFGPMLAFYLGLRRDEFCGLSVDDVVHDYVPDPYLRIRVNDFRRVKNAQSVRDIAIHPELIRLGFLDYVVAIAGLGEKRLFPELFSPWTGSPVGDRYHDELEPSFKKAGLTTHQFRHAFNNELKQRRVTEEIRADLMGHGGKSETTERYCDPIAIKLQLEDLLKLPTPTADLPPAPIRLLAWVVRRERAPWARQKRRPNPLSSPSTRLAR